MLVFIIADENYFKDLSMDSEIRKNQTTSSISNNKSLSSKWIEDSGTFLQYYLKSDNRLYDVSLIKVINNEVIFSATANEALIEKNYILLKEPYNYKNFKIDKNVSEKILFNFPKILQLSSTNIKNLTLIEQIDYLSEIEDDSALSIDSVFKSDLEKNIFKTIFLPISAIAIMLLAGSLTFGSLRDSSMGTRIIIGVIFSFIYNVVQDLTLSIFITYSLSIIFAVFVPILIVLFLSFLIYRRI
jgi:lipopolysaccharide export system permease protein